MLGFNMNIFSRKTAVLDHFRKPLNDDSLRSYRIRGDDLGTRKTNALSESLVA